MKRGSSGRSYTCRKISRPTASRSLPSRPPIGVQPIPYGGRPCAGNGKIVWISIAAGTAAFSVDEVERNDVGGTTLERGEDVGRHRAGHRGHQVVAGGGERGGLRAHLEVADERALGHRLVVVRGLAIWLEHYPRRLDRLAEHRRREHSYPVTPRYLSEF